MWNEQTGRRAGRQAEESRVFRVSGTPAGRVEVGDFESRNQSCHAMLSEIVQASAASDMPYPDTAMVHLGASLILLEGFIRAVRVSLDVANPGGMEQEKGLEGVQRFEAISSVVGLAVELMRSTTGVAMMIATRDVRPGGHKSLIDRFPSDHQLHELRQEMEAFRTARETNPQFQELIRKLGIEV
jgi:hypothetical protein